MTIAGSIVFDHVNEVVAFRTSDRKLISTLNFILQPAFN